MHIATEIRTLNKLGVFTHDGHRRANTPSLLNVLCDVLWHGASRCSENTATYCMLCERTFTVHRQQQNNTIKMCSNNKLERFSLKVATKRLIAIKKVMEKVINYSKVPAQRYPNKIAKEYM